MKTRTFKTRIALAVVGALAVCLLALAACSNASGGNASGGTSFTFEDDGQNVHVIAENGSNSTQATKIEVKSASGLTVTSTVNEGLFHVTITDSSGKAVFDKDIEKSDSASVPVEGTVEVQVDAISASGKLDITQA